MGRGPIPGVRRAGAAVCCGAPVFLLKSIGLIALLGLFVQAFLAWIFVAVLMRVRRSEPASKAVADYSRAFLALAGALTIMSFRFFISHDRVPNNDAWADGRWAAVLSYMGYGGLKTLFGLFLLRGSHQFVGHESPRWLVRAWWPLVLAMTCAPMVIPHIEDLLALQAPMMIGCAIASVRVLPRDSAIGSGMLLVRLALMGLALSWGIHAVAVLWHTSIPLLRYVLAFNSFIDLAVQLTLGTGLIISVLLATHARMRAAERERAQLQRTIDRDEKLRALGTLVSGVAHELNNPLTVILGYAELLDGQDGAAAAKVVGEQAERCRAIVRNLSALAGQRRRSVAELSLQDLVDRIVRGIQRGSSPDAPVMRVLPVGPLRLISDRIGLEQVLTNLVVNAMQASPPRGEIVLAVSATPDGAEFTVSDQGPGVPPELRARLFEPFFTTKDPGKGTGLGLSIAHAIVRANGGTIAIEDGPGGRGACFRVTVPNSELAAIGDGDTPAPRSRPGRLLVIDDDDGVRAVVRGQAERRGWSVTDARSAEEALGLAVQFGQVDTVLCDLRMPGIGGIGLHDRLQQQDPEVLQRFVFFTGDLASPESAAFSRRCTRPLVEKPFDFDELFTLLARNAVARAV